MLSDVDRPVSARGQHALSIVAAEVGAFVQPDSFVLCSPAVRTRQTFDLARPHCQTAASAVLIACMKAG